MLSGRILVTGGAGYLSRAIYRRAAAENWPAEFTAFSRDDAKHAALQARFPQVQTVLGDVAGMSVEAMANLFRAYDLVIHAAAQKYVDRSERHAWDTCRVNIEGSRNVAMAAVLARVPKVIGISTDKACAPVNTYGLTKAVMERLFQEATGMSPATDFLLCRYGNVVGSTGSVIPLFARWAQAGEPVRVTNSEMTRFWMSPDEAVDTILWTVRHGQPGHITVPRMRSMRMRDLATAIYNDATGFAQDYDRLVAHGHIVLIGERPGEKMHEQIIAEHEQARARWSLLSRDGDPPPRFAEIAPSTAPPHEDTQNIPAGSDQPSGGPMAPGDMLAIIRDAATI